MVDLEDTVFVLLLIAAAIFPLLFIGAVIDLGFIEPLAAEKAQTMCQEQGYDTYISYERILFSKTPLAIKCGNTVNADNEYNIIMNGGK